MEPPGKKPVEDMIIEIEQNEINENLGIEIEELEEEETVLLQKLARVRLDKKIKQAGPKVEGKMRDLEKAQRRIIEGERLATNSGGRVEKEIAKLDPKIKKLKEEFTSLHDRMELLKRDKGKTYGSQMKVAGQDEVDKLLPEVQALLEENKVEDVNLDEFLEAVV